MTPRGVRQFRAFIVRPTLQAIGLHSAAAENIVVGTGAQESGYDVLSQRDAALGPGIGFFQIELATHDDLWANFLHWRAPLAARLQALMIDGQDRGPQLASNLAYSVAICRAIYARAPDPLPDSEDITGLGAYWKRFYNTKSGAGAAEEWTENYERLCRA